MGLTPEQYEDIRSRVISASKSHYIQKADVDDIIQEVAMDVFVNGIPPNEIQSIISKHLGRFRQIRTREMERMVRLV